jgi:hypothetical protein
VDQHRSSILRAIVFTIALGGLSTTGAVTAAPATAGTDATPFRSGHVTPRAEGTVFRLSARQASPRVVRVDGRAEADSRVRLEVDGPGVGVDVAVVKTTASGRFTLWYPRIDRPGRYLVTATFLANARFTTTASTSTSFRIR